MVFSFRFHTVVQVKNDRLFKSRFEYMVQDTCYQMKRGQDKNWSPNRVADRYDLANRNRTVCSWLPKDGNDFSLLSICNEERQYWTYCRRSDIKRRYGFCLSYFEWPHDIIIPKNFVLKSRKIWPMIQPRVSILARYLTGAEV